MYTLKSIAQRGVTLGAAFAIVAATIVPAAPAFADALNPLTERSLLLSSSAPGFTDTDGSGNAETIYSPPGSGPNGKKTGETFTFKVSTDSTQPGKAINAMTLQYCTSAAGNCQAPGNNLGDARSGATTARETNAVAHPLKRSDLDVAGTWTEGTGAGQFQVLVGGVAQTGWAMTAINAEDTAHSGALTGKNNLIRLTKAADTTAPTAGQQVQVIFKASTTNYITNPGAGSFFVKINTYDSDTVGDLIPATPAATNTHIIDGGVTVANVMTESIHITTKVLETMSFSVGTHNEDKDNKVNPDKHGTCEPIQVVNANRLNLGNPDAEFSLETGRAWDVYSYWRLSSNSSGGATVYYSGDTLANTVGDRITPIGATETLSNPGTEQFGLGFAQTQLAAETHQTFKDLVTSEPTRYRDPALYTLNANTSYDEAEGLIYDDDDTGPNVPTAKFAFERESLTEPRVIAADNDDVIRCSTAKMRYVANIGADTPAGVYTTKVNYLAAPQY